MTITQEIARSLQQALQTIGFADIPEVSIEPTTNAEYGDYTCTIAMQLYKRSGSDRYSSPFELASAIVKEIQAQAATNYLPSALRPGFINFTLTNHYFTSLIPKYHDVNSLISKFGGGRLAIVEYSSPNIAKPFTVGHLRSTIIGAAVATILEAVGYDVRRDNHLGDWGTQFGKLIVAIKELGAGSESENIHVISNAEEPVKELVKLYVQFHEMAEQDPSLEERARLWFSKLEHGDSEARQLWQQCVDWSWQEFERIYTELNVAFSENNGRGYGEAFFEDKMAPVVSVLSDSGYLQEGKEGAKLFVFPHDELPPLMILKKDGSTLYATRDLATDKFRLEKYGQDVLVINEVGVEQELYFRQLYRIETLLGWYRPEQRVHVKHGHFRFKEGKMSTRKGNVVWLADVIAEAKRRAATLAKDTDPNTVSMIAMGALKWNDLKRAAHLDVTFDWDEILAMSGNSGPYLQYTAVRCKSILEKASGVSRQGTGDSNESYNYDAAERSVARELLYFPTVVEQAAREYAPHHLCTYLYGLASAFNSFYNTHRVIGEPDHETARLQLTEAVAAVLEYGLRLLGIEIPAKM